MKLLSSNSSSFSEKSALKSAWKGLSKCVCASNKTTRTKSPFVDDDEDYEDAWLLGTQPAGLNNLPEASTASAISKCCSLQIRIPAAPNSL